MGRHLQVSATVTAVPVSVTQGPILGLMLCYSHLEMCNNFIFELVLSN